MLAGIRATVPTYMSNMYSYAWYTLRLDRLQGLWTYKALGPRAASTSSNKVMKAWVVTSYDGFEKLTLSTTAEMPLIQNPDDVLVKVHASSVNPIDIKVLGGYGASTLNLLRKTQGLLKNGSEFPFIPGRDFSGEVVSTGKGAKASRFQPGDEVWGAIVPVRPQGCMAEYAVIPAEGVTKKPSGVTHVEAASIPYVTLTVWAALCNKAGLSANNTANKRVLILGGSGGVGTFAIQLMKAWGAEVTTTCSGNAVEQLTNLGADEAIDYRSPDVDKSLQEIKGFDVIFDCTSDQPDRYMSLLKGGGSSTYVTILSPILTNMDNLGIGLGAMKSAVSVGSWLVKGRFSGKNYHWSVAQMSEEALKTVADLVSSNKIKPVIDQTFGFNEAQEAYRKVSKGPNRGKTVVDMNTTS